MKLHARQSRWGGLCAAGVALALAGTGCTNLRYFASYKYQHVRTEKERRPNKERRYAAGIFQESGVWVLKILELKRCEQRTVEVAQETAVITISSPTWYYFVGLGGLQAAVSTPFWILGARSKTAREARNNYLVGSLVFLLPGLAIAAVGAYFRLVSGTEEKPLGLKRRVKRADVVPCGTAVAAGRPVTLGTRTGPVELGKADDKGALRMPVGVVRPLVRWKGGAVEKVYFEVFVGDAPAVDVRVPKGYPVKEVDLREPTLATIHRASPRRASPRRASPRRASPRRASPRRAPARHRVSR